MVENCSENDGNWCVEPVSTRREGQAEKFAKFDQERVCHAKEKFK